METSLVSQKMPDEMREGLVEAGNPEGYFTQADNGVQVITGQFSSLGKH